jgi:hypothetical protein
MATETSFLPVPSVIDCDAEELLVDDVEEDPERGRFAASAALSFESSAFLEDEAACAAFNAACLAVCSFLCASR